MGLDFFFFSPPLLFLVWIGTGSFLWLEVFLSCKVSCVLQISPAHSISLCWRTAGCSPAHGMRGKRSRDKEKLLTLAPLNSLSALPMFWHSAGEGGRMESPNSTPSSAQDLPWAFLCSWGWSFPYFLGAKQDPSLQTLAGGQGWVLFPKKQLLPPVWLCWGCTGHIISFSCPSGSNLTTAVKLKKMGILPTGLKYCVCVSLFLNLLWANAVGTGQFCPVFVRICTSFLM